MITQTEILRSFIEHIRNISFLERIFSWRKTRNQLVQASEALGRLIAEQEGLLHTRQELVGELSSCRKDLQVSSEQRIRQEDIIKRWEHTCSEKEHLIHELNRQLTTALANSSNYEKQVHSANNELAGLKERLVQLEQKLKDTTRECIELRQNEEARKKEHSGTISTLQKITEQVRMDREKEIEESHAREMDRITQLKETWNNHQVNVKNSIRNICNKHAIEYAESVPFRGEPDNTIKICDEYIVFDAKSPGGNDLSNFPFYLKTQAEAAKKYAKQEGVKNDIFFVVPSNALECIRQNCHALADYNVYVISPDSLEPIILALKKIESYEFAQQLTPEERENICRIIGKFAHLTKRRIQIDSFFARQFIELVYKCESSLPEDILEKVSDFERAEKLNPPIEKRAKAINTRQLELDVTNLETEAGSKGIAVEDLSEGLNKVRLYTRE